MGIHSKPHVALLASPGLGHLIPIIELAKRLVTSYEFTVTVFVVTTHGIPAETELLLTASRSNLFNLNILPPNVNGTSSSPETDILIRLLVMIRGNLPAIRSAILDMKNNRPTAMIVDLFGTEAMKIAEEFNMMKYVYIASNAWFLALAVNYPYLEGKINFKENEAVRIPGCKPIPLEDIIEMASFKSHGSHLELVRIGLEIASADGVLVNTWEDLESRTLSSYKDEKLLKPIIKAPVYPIGPLVRTANETVLQQVGSTKKSELMEWLDMQPDESVVYVSFGSGGTISTQQTLEVAYGLETSQQRFIWVMRLPIDYDATASTYFEPSQDHQADEMGNLSKYLPDGFLDRTHSTGRVIPMWAPQEEILAHTSTGGFITHCGWNSTLESITNGVPMIAWPLYAEQDMNATMLAADLGVAVRPSAKPSKELVTREEIEKMVRRVMVLDKLEGNIIRSRVQELQKSSEVALSKDGSSYKAFSEVVKGCEMSMLLAHTS